MSTDYAAIDDDVWLDAWVSLADGGHIDLTLPHFPPPEIQVLTNSQHGGANMKAAWPLYLVLRDLIDQQRDRLGRAPRVLDLGAGWGRITRLLLRDSDALHAVDVDETLVEAGRQFLPEATWALMEGGKPLPFETGAFDLVFANSVFSHLSESMHLSTVQEVARVLRSGGNFVGTTLSRSHLQGYKNSENQWAASVLGDLDAALASLRDGRFVYGATDRWPEYGIAVIPDGWCATNWRPAFELERVDVGVYSQDINVARRVG